ncbi:hypothetical protein ABMA27_004279 [Loxostege sticticalis]|uniref:Reverse transcriptase n=1 Tax=Loxostege sticticalis TaxID=481309 RepID=A0ABR3HN03_LOXSC
MGLQHFITEFQWPPFSCIIRPWLPYSIKLLIKTNQTSPNSIGLLPEKLKETRLRWYGHIMRPEENYSVKTVLNIETQRRQRGRPPATWWSNVERDLKSQNLSPATTRDRISWRRCTRRPDPS